MIIGQRGERVQKSGRLPRWGAGLAALGVQRGGRGGSVRRTAWPGAGLPPSCGDCGAVVAVAGKAAAEVRAGVVLARLWLLLSALAGSARAPALPSHPLLPQF